MLQAVPLRARLGVNLDLVIQPNEALLFHLLHIMLERNATKARKLDIVHGPIKLDMPPGLNLKRSLLDSFSVQKVDG